MPTIYTGAAGANGVSATESSSGGSGGAGEAFDLSLAAEDIDAAGAPPIVIATGGNGGSGGSGYFDGMMWMYAGAGGAGGSAAIKAISQSLSGDFTFGATGGMGGMGGWDMMMGAPAGVGGSATAEVSGSTFSDLQTVNLYATGGMGGIDSSMMGMGGSGGAASANFSGNTVGFHAGSISLSPSAGMNGPGMMMMMSGFASVDFSNNTLTGTADDDSFTLNVSPTSLSWTGFTFSGNAFDGGVGVDTLTLNFSLSSWSAGSLSLAVDLGSGTLALNGSNNTVSGFENINLAGILAPGSTATVSLTGDDSDNMLGGTIYDDTILGGNGADTLRGNNGADTLYGDTGNDRLNGGGGDDIMYGGAGNDTYMVDGSGDSVSEESTGAGQDDGGTDLVVSYVSYGLGAFIENLNLMGTDSLTGNGNALNNRMVGNAGANTLCGFDGDDYLNGGMGVDTMYGGAGNDTYVVDNSFDIASEDFSEMGLDDGGIDQVIASVGFQLGAFIENLTLTGMDNLYGFGNALNNRMIGNSGDNYLSGLDGNDRLVGGSGADVLVGGAGVDTMSGGTGADIFVLEAPVVGVDRDVITDFESGTDTLGLDYQAFGLNFEHVFTSDDLHSAATLSSTSGSVFVYNTTSHVLYFDSNGSAFGGLIPLAVFTNGASLSASDFQILLS